MKRSNQPKFRREHKPTLGRGRLVLSVGGATPKEFVAEFPAGCSDQEYGERLLGMFDDYFRWLEAEHGATG